MRDSLFCSCSPCVLQIVLVTHGMLYLANSRSPKHVRHPIDGSQASLRICCCFCFLPKCPTIYFIHRLRLKSDFQQGLLLYCRVSFFSKYFPVCAFYHFNHARYQHLIILHHPFKPTDYIATQMEVWRGSERTKFAKEHPVCFSSFGVKRFREEMPHKPTTHSGPRNGLLSVGLGVWERNIAGLSSVVLFQQSLKSVIQNSIIYNFNFRAGILFVSTKSQ